MQHCSRRVKLPPKAGGFALPFIKVQVSHASFLCTGLQIARNESSPGCYIRNMKDWKILLTWLHLLGLSAKLDWTKCEKVWPPIAVADVFAGHLQRFKQPHGIRQKDAISKASETVQHLPFPFFYNPHSRSVQTTCRPQCVYAPSTSVYQWNTDTTAPQNGSHSTEWTKSSRV